MSRFVTIVSVSLMTVLPACGLSSSLGAANAAAQLPAKDVGTGAATNGSQALVAAAGPMAEAILAAAPATAVPVDAATLRARLTMIQWAARPEGTLVAQGRLGKLDVQVERTPSLNFYWQETGALIPYDVIGALRGRGAQVTLIGCTKLGVGETSKAYRINAPGRAPFGLSVYDRDAPTANADSFYNVGIDLSGRTSTLAQLRRDGSEWNETCPN